MKILDVIKYEGTNDVFVYKYPGEDFSTMSQLIVHSTQEAVFFKDGVMLDIFQPGKYTLNTNNLPLLGKLINLPFNGVSPFHCEVYFVSKVVSMDVFGEPEALFQYKTRNMGLLFRCAQTGSSLLKRTNQGNY